MYQEYGDGYIVFGLDGELYFIEFWYAGWSIYEVEPRGYWLGEVSK